MTVPVGPEAGRLAPLLKDFEDRLRELELPTFPQPVFAIAAASLPSAALYQNCVVLVTDLNILAHSDGTSWIRQDTGAAI